MSDNKDLYFVAVKVFIEDSSGRLLIIKDRFGDWDLPGGRLREMDFGIPLEDVVDRKIVEELGEAACYELGAPVVFMRHERDEVMPSGEKEKRRIFAVGYKARYLSGDISLGKNHERYEWMARDVEPEKYFSGGWLQGVREYLSYKK